MSLGATERARLLDDALSVATLLSALRLADVYRPTEADSPSPVERREIESDVLLIHLTVVRVAAELGVPTLGIAIIDDLATIRSQLRPNAEELFSSQRLRLSERRGAVRAMRTRETETETGLAPIEEGPRLYQVELRITSDPTRSRITFNGELLGRTPFAGIVESENPTARLDVRKTDFAAARFEVDMTEPVFEVFVELESRPDATIWDTYQFGGREENRSGLREPRFYMP